MKTTLALLVATATFLAAAAVQAEEARVLWDKNCASCHGKDGKGNTRMGKQANVKDYTDPKVQEEMKDDNAVKVIKEGLKENGKERMKPYAGKFSDEEIKGLIAYMRTFKK